MCLAYSIMGCRICLQPTPKHSPVNLGHRPAKATMEDHLRHQHSTKPAGNQTDQAKGQPDTRQIPYRHTVYCCTLPDTLQPAEQLWQTPDVFRSSRGEDTQNFIAVGKNLGSADQLTEVLLI